MNDFNIEYSNVSYHKRGASLIVKDKSTDSNAIIGKFVEKKDLVAFVKKEKEEDVLRKYNAWTVPEFIIDMCDLIYIETEQDVYKISKRAASMYGFYRNLGDEMKFVIPVKYWERKSEL